MKSRSSFEGRLFVWRETRGGQRESGNEGRTKGNDERRNERGDDGKKMKRRKNE